MRERAEIFYHLGMFRVAADVFYSHPELVLDALSRVMVYRVERVGDSFEYWGYSLKFDRIEEGMTVPAYQCEMNGPDEDLSDITWKRAEMEPERFEPPLCFRAIRPTSFLDSVKEVERGPRVPWDPEGD